jgi:drug/metabolite transporter (DMT)-like permease
LENQKKAYLYAALTVLLWSTVASAFKLTLRSLDFVQMLFLASAVSTAALFLILLVQGRWKDVMASSKSDLARSAALGLLNPFIYYLVLFKAYDVLPAQEAQPLNWTWPIMLVLLSAVLLKQRIGLKSIAAVMVSFAGVLVISTHGNILALRFSNALGAGLALSSSIVWALFWIYNVKDSRDEVLKLFLSFGFGSLYTLAAVILSPDRMHLSPAGMIGAAYIGLFEMGLTFVFWLRALKLSRTAAQVSNLVYLAPFLSLFFIAVIVGEEIRLSTVAGLVLIISGILIQRSKS